MARTTANLSLKVWDLLSDNFNHTELASNWDAIDSHDHTSGHGLQIPTGGLANLAVTTAKLADGAIVNSKVTDATLTSAKFIAAVQQALYSPGDLRFSAAAFSSTPTGWLFCDGASYLRTDYPTLFAALGGTSSPWGLVDGTHFNIPDFRGRVAMGVGTGPGLTARALSAIIGEEKHVLTKAELPAVGLTPGNGAGNSFLTIDGTTGGVGTSVILTSGSGIAWQEPATTENMGSGTAHNVVQPSTCVNIYIKI